LFDDGNSTIAIVVDYSYALKARGWLLCGM